MSALTSTLTATPTPTHAPALPDSALAAARTNGDPAPAVTPSDQTQGEAPEEYHSCAGCLMLSLVTIAALGALTLFVALFGDVAP